MHHKRNRIKIQELITFWHLIGTVKGLLKKCTLFCLVFTLTQDDEQGILKFYPCPPIITLAAIQSTGCSVIQATYDSPRQQPLNVADPKACPVRASWFQTKAFTTWSGPPRLGEIPKSLAE